MQRVVRDCVVDGAADGGLLWEVARGQAVAARARYDVVGRVLVAVGCLQAGVVHNVEECVDLEALVGIDGLAFAVDKGHGQMCRIDAAGEQQAGVVVDALIV